MAEIKTLGGFYCPHCENLNLCTCKTCKPFYEEHGIGDRKYAIWEDNGMVLVCQYCNGRFTLDDSLEVDYKKYKEFQDARTDKQQNIL